MEVSKCNFTVNIVIDMDSKNIIFFGGTGLIGNSVLNLFCFIQYLLTGQFNTKGVSSLSR